jgi:hypothetical protein
MVTCCYDQIGVVPMGVSRNLLGGCTRKKLAATIRMDLLQFCYEKVQVLFGEALLLLDDSHGLTAGDFAERLRIVDIHNMEVGFEYPGELDSITSRMYTPLFQADRNHNILELQTRQAHGINGRCCAHKAQFCCYWCVLPNPGSGSPVVV